MGRHWFCRGMEVAGVCMEGTEHTAEKRQVAEGERESNMAEKQAHYVGRCRKPTGKVVGREPQERDSSESEMGGNSPQPSGNSLIEQFSPKPDTIFFFFSSAHGDSGPCKDRGM